MADIQIDLENSYEVVSVCTGPCEKARLRRNFSSVCQREKKMNAEYEEYQQNSVAYEHELEALNKQSEERNKKLQLANNALEKQVQNIKMKYQSECIVSSNQQTQLEEERSAHLATLRSLRKNEIQNCKLSQEIRELKMTVEQKEEQLDELIEKLALLETDLEGNNDLQESVLRLEEENKALKARLTTNRDQRRNNIKAHKSLSPDNLMPRRLNRSTLKFGEHNQLWQEKTQNTDSVVSKGRNESKDNSKEKCTSKIRKYSTLDNHRMIKESFKAVIEELENSDFKIKAQSFREPQDSKNEDLNKSSSNKKNPWSFKKKMLNKSSLESDQSLKDSAECSTQDKSSVQRDQSKSKKGVFLNLLRPRRS